MRRAGRRRLRAAPMHRFISIRAPARGVASTLASFIKFLEEKRLVKFDIDEDSDECFENRLKLQKYVYSHGKKFLQ